MSSGSARQCGTTEVNTAAPSAIASRELPMRGFSKSLPMQLLRAREAVMRRFRPGLRQLKVTEQQWRVLRALGQSGELEAGALARVTCLLAPSLSRILPAMEGRQLISRRQVDSDLRRSVIRLERRGLRVLAAHASFSEKIYAEIARRFGPERLEQLFTLLQELETVAAGLPGALAATHQLPKSRVPVAGNSV